MRCHVITPLYPTGHSAVRLCNVTGDMLRYDAFVTILENPQQVPPAPAAIPTASANLLSATHTTETYAAKQKKGSTAMPKSRQLVPLPDKMPVAASSSKGKDKDVPAYKF